MLKMIISNIELIIWIIGNPNVDNIQIDYDKEQTYCCTQKKNKVSILFQFIFWQIHFKLCSLS